MKQEKHAEKSGQAGSSTAEEQEKSKVTETVEPVRPVTPVEVSAAGPEGKAETGTHQDGEKTEQVLSEKILGETGQKLKQLKEKLEVYLSSGGRQCGNSSGPGGVNHGCF